MRRAVIVRSSALLEAGILTSGIDEILVDCTRAGVEDELNRILLHARAAHVPVSAIVASVTDGALLGILDTGVDAVCLLDPAGAEAVIALRRACHYPPIGLRGVATTRSLGFGLTPGDLAAVARAGTAVRAGLAFSRPPADPQWLAGCVGEDAGGLPGLSAVALWPQPGQADSAAGIEALLTVLAPHAVEIQGWGVGSAQSLPPDRLALRAWSELELAAHGFALLAGRRT